MKGYEPIDLFAGMAIANSKPPEQEKTGEQPA